MSEIRLKLAALNKFVGPLFLSLLVVGCSVPDRSELKPKIEYYRPVQRKFAPEPVYSRVTWSHLPAPLPSKKTEEAPMIEPVMAFDLPDSTLAEAVEALAQAMGYRWVYPSDLKDRKVSIRTEGSVGAVLQEIAQQADVTAEIDTQQRLIRIYTRAMQPHLPAEQ